MGGWCFLCGETFTPGHEKEQTLAHLNAWEEIWASVAADRRKKKAERERTR